MDNESYRKRIEGEILKIIKLKLTAGKMNADRASEIARYILESLKPNLNHDQIYNAVKQFDKHFPELVGVMSPVVNHYEETVKKIVHEHASKLINAGRVKEATALTQKAIKKQVILGR